MKLILLTLGYVFLFGGALSYLGFDLARCYRTGGREALGHLMWPHYLFGATTLIGTALVFLARVLFAPILILTFVCIAPSAYAATAAAPGLDYGDFVAKVLALFATTIVSLIWYLVQKYVPEFYRLFLTRDVVTNAVNAALAEVEGAAVGKVIPIASVNSVILSAVAWANANEARALDFIKYDIQPLIVSKLSGMGVLPAEVSAATLVAAK